VTVLSFHPAVTEAALVQTARKKVAQGGMAPSYVTREELCALLAWIDRLEELTGVNADDAISIPIEGSIS